MRVFYKLNRENNMVELYQYKGDKLHCIDDLTIDTTYNVEEQILEELKYNGFIGDIKLIAYEKNSSL